MTCSGPKFLLNSVSFGRLTSGSRFF
uniref:Uncharacterized protein n=1 Tax=Arundo donax TaxID=35708 RepID=A0A0A9AJW2_ARUDO